MKIFFPFIIKEAFILIILNKLSFPFLIDVLLLIL